MRGSSKDKIVVVFLIIIFGIAVLFLGKSKTLPSGLVTIQINGVENQELLVRINKALKDIEGIRPVFLDRKTNTYTIRYDSSVVKYDVIKSSLLSIGIKIEKMEDFKKMADEKSGSILKIRITN